MMMGYPLEDTGDDFAGKTLSWLTLFRTWIAIQRCVHLEELAAGFESRGATPPAITVALQAGSRHIKINRHS